MSGTVLDADTGEEPAAAADAGVVVLTGVLELFEKIDTAPTITIMPMIPMTTPFLFIYL